MKTTVDQETGNGMPASSPCMLHELRPDGSVPVDPGQARDVARWRKAERERLISARSLLSPDYRAQQTLAITAAIEPLLTNCPVANPTISVYWPIRAEPDLRPWMHALAERGVRIALPLAIALRQPLSFREWRPRARLARGLWNIPYPADGAVLTPDVVIAPLVGFDAACYRLGYGGGFFDRTLAMLDPKPMAIGIGYSGAALRTIFPQPHDIPMDWIVTGCSPPLRR
ncbi:MAG: 5-formyltetrahydrofolate cyclo-ligase [Steroidobacterales bacterium]